MDENIFDLEWICMNCNNLECTSDCVIAGENLIEATNRKGTKGE